VNKTNLSSHPNKPSKPQLCQTEKLMRALFASYLKPRQPTLS
jgi:hypothetical protein